MHRTLVTLLAILAGCAKPEPPNIVLIVIDTARADHFSCYGYNRETTPNIDEFARDAVLYRNARAPSPWTLPSHASLFTGLPPGAHGLHWSGIPAPEEGELPARISPLAPAAESRLLASVLTERGYRTVGVSNNPWISERTKLNGGFDHFVWRPRPRGEDRSSADRSLRMIDAYFEREVDRDPFFLFLNLIEPHFLYAPPQAFQGAFGGDPSIYPERDRLELALLAGAVQFDPLDLIPLYDEELRYVDDVVGDLLDWLRDRGEYENSMIVVTSDHGELLGEQGRFSHQLSVAEELIRIPLIIKYPGNEHAGVAEENPMVSLTDVYETALATSGVSDFESGKWSQDLRHMDRFSREWTISEYFFSAKYLRQLRAQNPDFDAREHEVVKRVVFADGQSHVLRGDELEATDTNKPPLRPEIRTEVEEYVRSLARGVPVDDSQWDEATRDALRALGYAD